MRHLLMLLAVLLTLLTAAVAERTFCSSCEGSGKCHVCEGTGLRSDGTTCSHCSGSKKCYYCGGQGKY